MHKKYRNPNRGSQAQSGQKAAARPNLDSTRSHKTLASLLKTEWSKVLWLRRSPNFVARNDDQNPTSLYTTDDRTIRLNQDKTKFRVSGVLNWYNSNWSSRVCGCQTNEFLRTVLYSSTVCIDKLQTVPQPCDLVERFLLKKSSSSFRLYQFKRKGALER